MLTLSGVVQRLQASEKPPVFLELRSSKTFILSAACFAVFTDIFLYAVIVPVIPFALTARAGIAAKDVQRWVSMLLAVYGATLCLGSPICGWLADRSESRRAPFLGGLVLLAGSTVMLCLGKSIAVLVAARALQGLSASIVWVVGLALIADACGPADAGRAMGYASLAFSLGTLIAPLLGGVVYEKAGYYAVYGMCFGLVCLDVILRLLLIETKQAARWCRQSETPLQILQKKDDINLEQQAESSQAGTASPVPNEVPQAAAPHRRRPTLFILLRSQRVLAAAWATVTSGVILSAFDATLPLFVHRTFGWNSTGSGLIFLALIVPTFFGPVVGRLSDKYGARWLAASGFLLMLPFWILLRLVTHDTVQQVVLLCTLLALIGTALTICIAPIMAEFSYIVEAKEKQQPGLFGATGAAGTSYSIFNGAYAAGFLIGPVWAGFVEKRAGWATMTLTLGAFSAVSALPIVIYTGGLITRRKTES